MACAILSLYRLSYLNQTFYLTMISWIKLYLIEFPLLQEKF